MLQFGLLRKLNNVAVQSNFWYKGLASDFVNLSLFSDIHYVLHFLPVYL